MSQPSHARSGHTPEAPNTWSPAPLPCSSMPKLPFSSRSTFPSCKTPQVHKTRWRSTRTAVSPVLTRHLSRIAVGWAHTGRGRGRAIHFSRATATRRAFHLAVSPQSMSHEIQRQAAVPCPLPFALPSPGQPNVLLSRQVAAENRSEPTSPCSTPSSYRAPSNSTEPSQGAPGGCLTQTSSCHGMVGKSTRGSHPRLAAGVEMYDGGQ